MKNGLSFDLKKYVDGKWEAPCILNTSSLNMGVNLHILATVTVGWIPLVSNE